MNAMLTTSHSILQQLAPLLLLLLLQRSAKYLVRSSLSGRILSNHGTGVRFILYELCLLNLIRFLAKQRKRAQRYHVDALRYRGVHTKQDN